MTPALIPLPIAIPLIVAAFLALTGEWIGRRASDIVAITTSAANIWITIVILRGVWLQPQVYWFGNWWPRAGNIVLSICFTVDAIGAALAVLTRCSPLRHWFSPGRSSRIPRTTSSLSY